ncbi:MAG: PepSY domain-containing protein [Planctomycetes bacterium]|nr:PepSY domain-containing protein [Planctomycetota bacterium]
MRGQVLCRKVHYWVSAGIALPIMLVILSGLLLQVKKDFEWIQPAEQRGRGGAPRLCMEQLLAVCMAIPEVSVAGWGDITRVDIRPENGLMKVSTENGMEVQVDAADGQVLQVASRRSDVIEALHDGSWFGGVAKRWVFLPSGVLLAVLWGTGVYLFVLPQWRKFTSKSRETR